MATQLFLLDTVSDTHLGTDNVRLRDSASTAWSGRALGTSRGSGVTNTYQPVSVLGPTAGIEVGPSIASYVGEWISPPVSADVTISGTITANIWGREADMNANVAINVLIEIIRANTTTTRNSNTLVEIVRSTRVTELAVSASVNSVSNFTTGMTSGAYTGQTLNRGDRLRVRVFGDDAGTMAAGFGFSASYNGTTAAVDGDTYVTFTEDFSFESGNDIRQEVGGGAGLNIGGAASTTYLAQSFTTTVSGGICGAEIFLLAELGTVTDGLTLELRPDNAGAPSTTVLASATLADAALSASAWNVFGFTAAASVSAATTYWIVVYRTGAIDAANRRSWDQSTTTTFSGAPKSSSNNVTWGDPSSTNDLRFRIAALPAGSTLYLTNEQSGLSSAPALISSFTGSDEDPLSEGGNFAITNSAGVALRRVSNSVGGTAGGGISHWTPANFGPDVETYVTISTLAGINGVLARIQGEGGSNTFDGYLVRASSTQTLIQRYDNAIATTLLTATTTWASGDKIGIRIEGSTIQAWQQDVSVSSDWKLISSVVDATYGSAGKIALLSSDTTARLDDFYAATDSNLFTQKAWTSRGSGVVSYLSDTDAGWVAPLYTNEWFTPGLTAFTLTGMAQLNIRALESNASANASLRCEIARVDNDGTNPTVWASWCMAPTGTDNGELTTSEVARTVNLSGDDLAFTNGQRLRLRIYAEDISSAAMGNAFNVQPFYNGTSAAASGDSYITLAQSVTEYTPGAGGGMPFLRRQRRASRFLTFR